MLSCSHAQADLATKEKKEAKETWFQGSDEDQRWSNSLETAPDQKSETFGGSKAQEIAVSR
jgi:hypothetical protein